MTNTIERIDVSNDGELADIGVFNVIISADGRVVGFDTFR